MSMRLRLGGSASVEQAHAKDVTPPQQLDCSQFSPFNCQTPFKAKHMPCAPAVSCQLPLLRSTAAHHVLGLITMMCGIAGLLQAVRQDHLAAMTLPSQLGDYLDTRRALFPRFSFLSNEALLDLMARCTDNSMAAVQGHITAMFPGIGSLEALGEAGKTEEIHAVMSPEGERVALAKGVKVSACTCK